MRLQILLVFSIISLLVLVVLASSQSKNKIEFNGRVESVCIQNPPDYGCGFPSPDIKHENDKVVIVRQRHWGAQISWNSGFTESARINGFNSQTSLRCFNLDCTKNEGHTSGNLIIEFNDKTLNGRYRGDVKDGSIFGTFTINGGSGVFTRAKGRGNLIITTTGGLVSGDIVI